MTALANQVILSGCLDGDPEIIRGEDTDDQASLCIDKHAVTVIGTALTFLMLSIKGAGLGDLAGDRRAIPRHRCGRSDRRDRGRHGRRCLLHGCHSRTRGRGGRPSDHRQGW